jgi:hypothetical protein
MSKRVSSGDPGVMSEGEAGASAQDKYATLTRAWRRRRRRLFLTVSAICGAVFVLSLIGWHRWPHLAFMFGMWGGAAMSFWLMVRDSPPAWIEQWQQGAFGEQATGKQLKRLERDGWIVLHDLPRGSGNVDHVLVGPGGVFVLDSKRTDGRVVVKEGTVTVTRVDDPELQFEHTGTPHLLRLAWETHERVLSGSRINQWVTPVMVWWADFPQRVVEERCIYVHGEELVTWLQGRPTQIAASRLAQVAEAVQAAWLPAEDTVPS